MNAIKRSPLILFYILVAYVFLQFCWWAYLIYDLNLEIHELKVALDPTEKNELEGTLTSKIWMITGEGTVFLTLLFIGFYQVKKAFEREVRLANQQRNFLLSITHELNSPLASVRLYLQTLLSRKITDEKRDQLLHHALAENDRLNKLVDNVLVATRLDNSTYTFYFERFNWGAFLESVLKDNPKAQDRVILDFPEQPIRLPMDKNALASITTNLVENALKYSPSSAPVTCSLTEASDSSIALTVTDEGKGIVEAEKKQIFNKFYRIGNEETRKSKGTGLGLYIVQFLVKNLKGDLTVENNVPEGTRFKVLFYPNKLRDIAH